jgi:hypothetical protein
MATVSDLQNIVYSGNPQADSLLDSPPPWNLWPDGRKVIYYTFDASAGSVAASDAGRAITAFNASQQQATRQILQYVATVTGIPFSEVSGSSQADWHFVATNIPGASTAGLASTFYNYSYNGSQVLTRLNAETVVYLDNVEHAGINNQPTAGGAGYEVLLHEVGHALGLAHPFESPKPLPAAQDNTNNTVMSYTHAGPYKTTFQAYDLLALDWIYGRDGLGGTWGFNSTNGPSLALGNTPAGQTGTPGPDVFNSTSASETFDGAGGVDALVAHGPRAGYTLARKDGGGWLLTDGTAGRDGVDTLQQVERVRFSDRSVALDLDGSAGTTARFVGALVGPSGLGSRELVGVVLGVVDSGATPLQLAQLGLNAVLGASASPERVVALLYGNVVGAAADAGTVQALASLIKSGAYTNASLAVAVANLDLNAAHIDLVGLANRGLDYV